MLYDVLKIGVEDIHKGERQDSTISASQPLILRMTHPRALPYTVLLSAFIATYIFIATPPIQLS
jgi:hypothetical protein